jgi:hypothetical protein
VVEGWHTMPVIFFRASFLWSMSHCTGWEHYHVMWHGEKFSCVCGVYVSQAKVPCKEGSKMNTNGGVPLSPRTCIPFEKKWSPAWLIIRDHPEILAPNLWDKDTERAAWLYHDCLKMKESHGNSTIKCILFVRAPIWIPVILLANLIACCLFYLIHH